MIPLPGGDLVILTAEEAALLATVRPREDRWWRSNGTTTPQALAELLDGLGSVATGARGTGDGGSGAVGTAEVPAMVASGTADRCSSWPRVTEAARRLGVSDRGVRKAITEGRLRAVRDREGAYRCDPEALDTYRPRRSTHGRRTDGTAA